MGKWASWKLGEGTGITSTIHDHLGAQHYDYWWQIVFLERLKGWDTIPPPLEAREEIFADSKVPVFTLEGFYEKLARWIVIDDQVIDLHI